MYKRHSDFLEYREVSSKELNDMIHSRVLQLQRVTNPIIIERIELLCSNGEYFVRTTATDGLQGISVTNDRVQFIYPILEKLIAPYFIGKDARNLEQLLDEVYVYKNNYKLAGIPYFCCIAYLELSILDMLAKAANSSIGELFGERINSKADIYVASGNRHTTPEEELEVLRARVERTGAKAIKYKIGGRMSNNKDSMQGRSKTLIYKTREYFGEDMIIHADGNGSYDVEKAVEYGKILEEINAYFYEEPCPFDDLWSTKATKDSLCIPLAFGEQETSMTRFKWLIEQNACDVIQPDILYTGGLIKTTKIARMAELAGKTITPHVSTGFCFVYILLLSSYTPNIGKYQESKDGLELAKELMDGAIELKDGQLNIPEVIGLGIDYKHDRIKKAITIFEIR
ncbi:mandelate racemase/muconate lactonizing enzyme family protein [Lachnoclostridium phytofermentans]|uniref:mandelate racemase/muconate lactonizing enzyme family protein n=1 Tax=Lachnoclostridium phytofermentans TaxID=66219 RepID=UPI0006893DDB|nr:mandelate racemase/muconate lactonizing enzyme family protein [Lachnoclostridium phytofermentans]